MNCGSLALFSLADVTAKSWSLQIDLFQTNWSGGVGVFWGYHQPSGESGPETTFQFIEIRRLSQNWHDSKISVRRGKVSSRNRTDGGDSTEIVELAAITLDMPAPRPQLLELTIYRDRVKSVRWSGKSLQSLYTDEVNGKTNEEEYRGILGTYTFRNDAIYSNARLMLH